MVLNDEKHTENEIENYVNDSTAFVEDNRVSKKNNDWIKEGGCKVVNLSH